MSLELLGRGMKEFLRVIEIFCTLIEFEFHKLTHLSKCVKRNIYNLLL